MSFSNNGTRFGSVTKLFHWVTALLILCTFIAGVIAHDAPTDTAEDIQRATSLFTLHKTLGVAVFFVALARILWAITQTKPALINAGRALEAFLAELVHWLLYVSLVLVPLSGWVHHAAATGFAPIWWPFGQSLPFVPKDATVSDLAGALHHLMIWLLLGSVFLHVAGALKHHVVDRDATLRRMLPGRTEGGDPSATHAARLPGIAAVVVLGAVLVSGWASGMFETSPRPGNLDLEPVASDWAVESGTLSISVIQMGAKVAGAFDTWVASITFDDASETERVGRVQVEIDIGSLQLGSSTKNALEPNYLAVAQHPIARYNADLFRLGPDAATGYEARGTLALRGVELPVNLPFDLELSGDKAQMTGQVTLNRLDFTVGEGMTDQASLAYPVEITVELVARKSTD